MGRNRDDSSLVDRTGGALEADALGRIEAGNPERERERVLPFDAIEMVREARLGALRLPVERGGEGVTLRELLAFVVRLAAADPNVAQILRMHYFVVETLLAGVGSSNNETWLRMAAEGAIFGGSLTEIGSGSTGAFEASAFATAVREREGTLRLDGEKYYSTGSMFADVLAITARGIDDSIVTVMVPADRDGVTLEDDWDSFGQALTGTGTSRFVDVALEPGEIIGEAESIESARYAGPLLQLYLTAVIAGIMRAAVRDAVALLRGRRRTFSHAPSPRPEEDVILQEGIGRMESAAFAAEALVGAAADLLDAAAADPGAADAVAEASLAAAKAKVIVDRLAGEVGWSLFDAGGASGVARAAGLDRHWRNARAVAAHNPASYKAAAIGDRAINGAPPPQSWFF
ncbi:MAG TPA: acyl-CoA dehydrogenase family protein [Solirubrobacterales bacterium]